MPFAIKLRMGLTLLKIKIMPESTELDLNELKNQVQENISEVGGKLESSEEEPIAFGLKALIATISWPETHETELAVESINKIEGVSSCDIIDYRRALG